MQKTREGSKRIANPKILGVVIHHKADYDGDSSYLGEFSTRAKTEYAIDRRHSEDCAAVSQSAIDAREKLERVAEHAAAFFDSTGKDFYEDGEEETRDFFEAAIDEITECDCGGNQISSRQCEYFNGNVENHKGCDPAEIRKYIRQDYDRMMGLENGDWFYMGIYATAEIGIPQSQGGYLLQELRSPGLWGIESDSEKSYFAEVQRDELAQLRDVLESFGFKKRAIATAFKSAEVKEEN